MSSELKSETARTNGAKSRGPKTEATRAISSRNSLRHGFTSRHTTLLECENPAEFQEILDGHFATFRPAGPAQEYLVNEMISAHWRLRRVRIVETQLVDLQMVRNKAEVEKQFVDPGATIHLAETFRTLVEDSRSLALLSRYESRLFRMHERSYRTLRELQRPGQRDPEFIPPSPEPPATIAPAPGNKNKETNPPAPTPVPRRTDQPTPQPLKPAATSSQRRKFPRRSPSLFTNARFTLPKLLRRK
jgi:hypothetical protein